MRLIDADALIEKIKKNDGLPWHLDKISQCAFISCIKHAQTAYDVDKVVERLERTMLNRANPCEALCFAVAIAIVKGDGVNE